MKQDEFEQRLSEVCSWKWVPLPEAPSNPQREIRVVKINPEPCEFGLSNQRCKWEIRAKPTQHAEALRCVTRRCTTCKGFLTGDNQLMLREEVQDCRIREESINYSLATIRYSTTPSTKWRVDVDQIKRDK
jgi:hypothetical protein